MPLGTLLARAIALLKAAPVEQVRTHFGYKHLLVDELQDTNAAQVTLIRTLRARLDEAGLQPTLFGVGDPKQSIYRFRGAEVDVFEDLLSYGRSHVDHSVNHSPIEVIVGLCWFSDLCSNSSHRCDLKD